MENQIKELEALVVILARRVMKLEQKNGGSVKILSDSQLLKELKKDAEPIVKNL